MQVFKKIQVTILFFLIIKIHASSNEQSETFHYFHKHEEKLSFQHKFLNLENEYQNSDIKKSKHEQKNHGKQLEKSIIDISNISSQHMQDLLAIHTNSFKERNNSINIQYFVANFLIKMYSEHRNLAYFKKADVINKWQKFDSFTLLQQVCNLQEILELIDLNLKFLPEEKTFVIYKEYELLYEESIKFVSKHKDKLGVIIPHHVIDHIKLIDINEIDKLPINMLKIFFNFNDILHVHLHGDKSWSADLELCDFIDFLMEFCSSKNIYSIEISDDAKSSMRCLNDQVRYFTKVTEYELYLSGIAKEITIDLRLFCNLKCLQVFFEATAQPQSFKYLCNPETYHQMSSIKYINLDVDAIGAFFVFPTDFINLKSLILENATVTYLVYKFLLEQQYFDKITFVDVLCKDFMISNTEINTIISTNNGQITKLKIEDLTINVEQVFGDFSSFVHLKGLILSKIVYRDNLLSKSLSIPQLETLYIDFIESKDSNITIPNLFPSCKTLKSLTLICSDYEHDMIWDLRNLEQCKKLQELCIATDFNVKVTTFGFLQNSIVLQNLTYLVACFNSSNFNLFFNGIVTQQLNINILNIGITGNNYEHYQQLFNNPYLKESLQYLTILDETLDTGALQINLRGYKNIKILELQTDKNFTSKFFKHLLEEKIIYGLEKVSIKQDFIFDFIFLNLITEIKELNIFIATSLFDSFCNLEKECLVYNKVQILTIHYSDDKVSLYNESKIVKKIFPSIKRLICQNGDIFKEMVYFSQTH